jgi:hypothetical protein
MEKMMIAEHMQNVDCGKTVEKSRLKMEKESKQKDLLRIHKGRKAANKRLKETI